MNARIMSKLFALIMAAATFGLGCQNKSDGFSLLSESNVFRQSTAYTARPIDVLWVVDNSGSMATSQTNLANNFRSFIQQFQAKGYDFRMAVGTTDAYLRLHYNQDSRARFKDGSGSQRTGIYIMDKNTPSLSDVFTRNVRVGTSGSGDERAFESLKQLLVNPLNMDFRREDAYLSIIIVSDEEDMSHYDWFNGNSSYVFTDSPTHPSLFNPSTNPIHPTLNPQHGLHLPEMFKSFLDSFTKSSSSNKNYLVNSIIIKDEACRAQLGQNSQKLAPRVQALTEMTGGTAFSLCQPFDQILDAIQQQVIRAAAATFQLIRTPIVSSITVRIDGQILRQDPVTGWIYDAATNSIVFADPPPAGAIISIDFDPEGVKI